MIRFILVRSNYTTDSLQLSMDIASVFTLAHPLSLVFQKSEERETVQKTLISMLLFLLLCCMIQNIVQRKKTDRDKSQKVNHIEFKTSFIT